jgi:hypothetical protein
MKAVQIRMDNLYCVRQSRYEHTAWLMTGTISSAWKDRYIFIIFNDFKLKIIKISVCYATIL